MKKIKNQMIISDNKQFITKYDVLVRSYIVLFRYETSSFTYLYTYFFLTVTNSKYRFLFIPNYEHKTKSNLYLLCVFTMCILYLFNFNNTFFI